MGELAKKKFVVVIVVIAILLSLFATVVLVLNFLVFAFPDYHLLPFFDRIVALVKMMTSSRPVESDERTKSSMPGKRGPSVVQKIPPPFSKPSTLIVTISIQHNGGISRESPTKSRSTSPTHLGQGK
jgi:hypothetical protein